MMHILGKIVWLITAFASIAIGAAAVLGFDLWTTVPVNAVYPMNIIIGIAGLLSLLMCFQKCMYSHGQYGQYGQCQCSCNKSV